MKNLDRFKFRWFDAKLKFMAEVIILNVKDNYAIVRYSYADEYTPDEEIKISDGILMQCTGLRDKNNKLVYENDIVSFSLENALGEIEYYKSTVEFKDDFYWFADRLDFVNVFDLEDRIDNKLNCEVVGNVYECDVKKP